MAKIIADYPLNIPHETPLKQFAGMIGDEIWLIHRVKRFEIEMFVFNIKIKHWVKVEYKNVDFVQDYYESEEEEEGEDEEGDEEVEEEEVGNVEEIDHNHNEHDDGEGGEEDDEDDDDDDEEEGEDLEGQEDYEDEEEGDEDDDDDDDENDEPGDYNAINVSMTNGRIFMFQISATRNERLLEFDREVLEWKLLKEFDNCVESIVSTIFNNKMFILANFDDDVVLKVLCMNTLEMISDATYFWDFDKEDVIMNIMEFNGTIYATFLDLSGTRSVYSIDPSSYECVKINEGYYGSSANVFETFLFPKDNCIYQVYDCVNGTKMEIFDVEKKMWTHIFTLCSHLESNVLCVQDNDGKLYFTYIINEEDCDRAKYATFVFDMQPSLSTLCALTIVRETPREKVVQLLEDVPIEVKYQLIDALSVQAYKPAEEVPESVSLEVEQMADSEFETEFVDKKLTATAYSYFEQFFSNLFK